MSYIEICNKQNSILQSYYYNRASLITWDCASVINQLINKVHEM